MLADAMSDDQVRRFMKFLDDRIQKHTHDLARSVCFSDHRLLLKTERAEAEVIRSTFLAILAVNGRKKG